MDPSKRGGAAPRAARSCRAWHRFSSVLLGAVSACGGTTGLEGIRTQDGSVVSNSPPNPHERSVAGDDPTAIDATTIDDATFDGDRPVPVRPPAKDTGAPKGDSEFMPDGGSDPYDPGDATTVSILTAQSAKCLACARDNFCLDPMYMGATCESLRADAGDGGSAVFAQGLPGSGTNAYQGGQPITEANVCLKVLMEIFSSKCGAVILGDLSACFCGDAGVRAGCYDVTNTDLYPNGPLYHDWTFDFGTTSPSQVFYRSLIQIYGAGLADALVVCLGQNGCTDCFATDGGAAADAGAADVGAADGGAG
jgi:hypothetical protein